MRLERTEWTRLSNMRRNLDDIACGPESPAVSGCITVLDKALDIIGYRWDIFLRIYRRKDENNSRK